MMITNLSLLILAIVVCLLAIATLYNAYGIRKLSKAVDSHTEALFHYDVERITAALHSCIPPTEDIFPDNEP